MRFEVLKIYNFTIYFSLLLHIWEISKLIFITVVENKNLESKIHLNVFIILTCILYKSPQFMSMSTIILKHEDSRQKPQNSILLVHVGSVPSHEAALVQFLTKSPPANSYPAIHTNVIWSMYRLSPCVDILVA